MGAKSTSTVVSEPDAIESLSDAAFDVLCATCVAARDNDFAIGPGMEEALTTAMADLSDEQRAVFLAATTGSDTIANAVEAERQFRKSPRGSPDLIHLHIGRMTDEQLDLLRATCESAALGDTRPLPPELQKKFAEVLNSMTARQKALVEAGAAGGEYIRAAAFAEHQGRSEEPVYPPTGYSGPPLLGRSPKRAKS
jgi:hypothetical protein